MQAIAILNIKVLVPMTLEKSPDNYGHLRFLFIVVLDKYNLKDHVISDNSYPNRSVWGSMDCCVILDLPHQLQ